MYERRGIRSVARPFRHMVWAPCTLNNQRFLETLHLRHKTLTIKLRMQEVLGPLSKRAKNRHFKRRFFADMTIQPAQYGLSRSPIWVPPSKIIYKHFQATCWARTAGGSSSSALLPTVPALRLCSRDSPPPQWCLAVSASLAANWSFSSWVVGPRPLRPGGGGASSTTKIPQITGFRRLDDGILTESRRARYRWASFANIEELLPIISKLWGYFSPLKEVCTSGFYR